MTVLFHTIVRMSVAPHQTLSDGRSVLVIELSSKRDAILAGRGGQGRLGEGGIQNRGTSCVALFVFPVTKFRGYAFSVFLCVFLCL